MKTSEKLVFRGYKNNKTCNFIKMRFRPRCFPVNMAKFLRTPILRNICEQLRLPLITRKSNIRACVSLVLVIPPNLYFTL